MQNNCSSQMANPTFCRNDLVTQYSQPGQSTRSQVRFSQVRDNVQYFNSLCGKLAPQQNREVHFDLHSTPRSHGHRSATPSPSRHSASVLELNRHILRPSYSSCDATTFSTNKFSELTLSFRRTFSIFPANTRIS